MLDRPDIKSDLLKSHGVMNMLTWPSDIVLPRQVQYEPEVLCALDDAVMPKLPKKFTPFSTPSVSISTDPFVETRARLQNAEQLRQLGQTERAAAICEELVRQHPRYMGALHTLGLLCAEKKEYLRALGFLNRAAMLNPRHWKTLRALSDVYLKLGAHKLAAQVLETAQEINPEDAGILETLGEIYHSQREYELAAEALSKALSIDATLAAAEFRLGQCRVYLGQYAEAAKSLQNAANQLPGQLTPLFWLAELPNTFINADLLPRIDKAVRSNRQDAVDSENLACFARAAVLDKTGRYAEAWEQLVTGNRAAIRERRENCEWELRRQREIFERVRKGRFNIRGGTPGRGRNAVSLFILGPSRSGKTTMERLLSAVDGVKRGYENPIALDAVRNAFQDGNYLESDSYENLPRELEKSCREFYLDDLERRAPGSKVFTNTDPRRIADAARIAAIVPNVRFIFVKRDLDDITVRIYMKRYARGYDFSYDIETIRQYVTWYYRMIDLLTDKLPDISRVVKYEDMVANPAAAVGSAVELCGIETPKEPLPELGDDRGCAEPYRAFLTEAAN